MRLKRQIPSWLAIGWWWLLLGNVIEAELTAHFHHTVAHAGSVADAGTWFLTAWGLLQAGWLWSADRRSRAVYWYAAASGFDVLTFVFDKALFHSWTVEGFLAALFFVASIAAAIIGIFVFRFDMTRYFRETDDPGFELSWWMSLIFSDFYFQYHFHRMAEYQVWRSSMTPADGNAP